MRAGTRLYRLLTASLLAVWLALLVGVLVYRQWQRRTVVTEAPSRPPAATPSEQPVRVQRGFVFTYALGVSPSIRLAARESVEFASGWVELTDVDVTFFQRGEVAYGLSSSKVRFHPRSGEALVEGDPLLSLGHGVAARGQAFTLEGGEQKLRSRGPVSFAGVGWGGLAGSLLGLLSEDAVVLGDGVSVVAEENGEPVTLLAPAARYRRKQGIVEFPSGLAVFRGGLHFRAPTGSLLLQAEGGTPEKLQLSGPVKVEGRSDGGEAVEGQWGDCQAQRQADGTWAFSAEAEATSGWAWLRLAVPGGETRELHTWRFEGATGPTGLARFEGQGLVCALSSGPREVPSRLSAEKLTVLFGEVQAQEVRALGNVVLEEAAGRAWGDELVAKLPDGPGELSATAGRDVRFASEGLVGACQRIAFDEQRNFTASGGVQGVVSEGNREKLRFAAAEARGFLTDANRVTLVGDARIWQEQQLLRADQILLDRQSETVHARGRVLSQSTGEGKPSFAIEARELTYVRPKGEALFTGAVRLHDPRGTMGSDSLLAYLSEKGEILRGEFRGNVAISEKGSGRRLFGDAAWYEGATESLMVTGQPAVAEEAPGNRVQASRIVWNRKSGSMDVGGDVDTPTQTLYHPEKPVREPARRTPLPRK